MVKHTIASAATLLLVFLATDALAQQPVQFNRDIRPILAEGCFECHGVDAASREADLRLDMAEGAYADRDGSRAIVPGELDASEVWGRINSDDPDLVMPPPDSEKSLTDEERDVIRRWIEEGAPYEMHWAFDTPVLPEEPDVENDAWVRNPIDRFTLARLEQKGLEPQPEADRETPFSCPRCQTGHLIEAHLASVPVDTCKRCHGIFLDLGEVHELMGAITRASSASDPKTAGFDNFALGLYIGANLGAGIQIATLDEGLNGDIQERFPLNLDPVTYPTRNFVLFNLEELLHILGNRVIVALT